MLRTIAVLCLLLSCCASVGAQTLKTTSLNLNAGGVVHDIAFIPQMNAYVVVGRFTSIGGQARKNIAWVDASTFAVMPQNPVTSMNGEIRTVEYYGIPTTTAGNVTTPGSHFLFIGGNFTQVNGAQREYMATLQYNEIINPLTAASNFGILNWNYMLNYDDASYLPGRFFGVNDLLLQNDTLIVTGNIYGVNVTSTTAAGIVDSYKLAGFKVNRSASARLNLIYTTTSVSIGYIGMGIGISGQHFYFGFADENNQTTKIYRVPRTLGAAPQLYDVGVNASPQSDKWYTAFKTWDATRMGMMSNARTGLYFRTFGPLNSFGEEGYELTGIDLNPIGGISFLVGYDFYNGDLLAVREASSPVSSYLQRYSENSSDGTTIDFSPVGSQTALLPATIGMDFNSADSSNRVIVRNNRMFLSAPELTNVGGQPRAGFAVFCLEPTNPAPFIAPDLQACEGDTIIYQIADVQYEAGYRWTYSGSGVEYSVNGGPFQAYTAPVYNSTANASSIKLRFPVGATSGTLTVEPYSVCNTSTDYQFAKPQSIAISVNPKPVLALAGGTEFTCIVDTLDLVALSSIATVDYQWFYPNPANPAGTNDTLTIFGTGAPSTIYPTGTYYVTITEPATTCSASGSVTITENTAPPTITQDSLIITPSEFTCIDTQMELSASVAGATIYWTTAADTTVQFPNPHTIYSPGPANYIAFAVSNTSGCIAQQAYTVQQNYVTIAGDLPAYPGFPAALIADTINCFTPVLGIQCGVDPSDPNAASGSAYWVLSGTTSLGLTTADSAGMFLQTKTYQFVTENAQNGCRDTSDVTIFFDLAAPFVAQYAGPSAINCSVDTVALVHLPTGGQVSESWLDPFGVPTGAGTIVANGTGTFVYLVADTINGCQSSDTVQVTQTSEMYLTGTPDTLVCQGDLTTVGVTPVNINETVTYDWSTGSVSDFTFVTGGADTLVSVIATTAGGCTGYDTIRVSIPPPVQLTTATFMSCGAASGSIQVTNVSGGNGSYQYAIDSGAFSANPLFDSLQAGTYAIYVQDALGCIYEFNETLDETAGAPEMNFLVTTYSGIGDTLAIVNTTIYQGFDSTAWVFPPNVNVLFDSDSLAFIQPTDTGWVNITLIGYEDSCSYEFKKPIYCGEVAPEYVSAYSSVKIQSVVAYPNPTTGDFTVDIVFGTAQEYLVLVTGDLGQPVQGMEAAGSGTTVSHVFSFPGGTAPGTYHIHVLGQYDARQFTIILN